MLATFYIVITSLSGHVGAETLSPYATWEYPWMRPPSRSAAEHRVLGTVGPGELGGGHPRQADPQHLSELPAVRDPFRAYLGRTLAGVSLTSPSLARQKN